MTIYWKLGIRPDERSLRAVAQEAAQLLRSGELVAFPTETVYGLGADARNAAAVRRIFKAKGRPADNPLIVHVVDAAAAEAVADVGHPIAIRLMEAFWPGPLTLVLPAKPGAVAQEVTAGLATVAVRVPSHPVALELIRAAGCPVAAPSANRSGRPSPTTADHVREDLDGLVAAVIDAGPTGIGLESTVVEPVDGGVRLLRPGGVPPEALRNVAGRVWWASADDASAPRSPGMKYAHYAPRGRLTLVSGGDPSAVYETICRELREAKARGEVTGVLTVAERADRYDADVVAVAGRAGDVGATARELYAALRRFDEGGATYILAEPFAEEGLGAAVMNRLRKAAGGREIRLDS
ncbi:MAG: threonylcarbamoyl-AMP synthase [Candidatus Reconcilbacillus cellulovorans]|uniref:Threonylcarbamoyl-AMP synthase n=1 Tax=Candidatus Reconcilbacillus cellulovorans TaxID=1906605 RepID=A0A2A6E0Q4_9BACL|nr:MAG: threonylcarbamoyl-AMP synthase [Candidatus Reconcilbacillus cellulovorans]